MALGGGIMDFVQRFQTLQLQRDTSDDLIKVGWPRSLSVAYYASGHHAGSVVEEVVASRVTLSLCFASLSRLLTGVVAPTGSPHLLRKGRERLTPRKFPIDRRAQQLPSRPGRCYKL
jgi:hypothetical protein